MSIRRPTLYFLFVTSYSIRKVVWFVDFSQKESRLRQWVVFQWEGNPERQDQPVSELYFFLCKRAHFELMKPFFPCSVIEFFLSGTFREARQALACLAD